MTLIKRLCDELVASFQRFALTNPWALLEVLIVLPEEVNSRHLRLGMNRREETIFQLKSSVPNVLKFLSVRFLFKDSLRVSLKNEQGFLYVGQVH